MDKVSFCFNLFNPFLVNSSLPLVPILNLFSFPMLSVSFQCLPCEAKLKKNKLSNLGLNFSSHLLSRLVIDSRSQLSLPVHLHHFCASSFS